MKTGGSSVEKFVLKNIQIYILYLVSSVLTFSSISKISGQENKIKREKPPENEIFWIKISSD